MTVSKRLAIIIPSYNDPRIVQTIRSVRNFDDGREVQLIVIDGNSENTLKETIRDLLEEDDIFVSEKDEGIFDALNKGLDLCNTDFLGWLGSDDMFTGAVRASDVIKALESSDLFVCNTAVFSGDRIRRITHALPSKKGLVKYGLHNPHFSTFGKSSVLRRFRFEKGIMGSDIAYFLRVFDCGCNIRTSSAICTLQCEGGFSSKSYYRIAKINLQLWSVYRRHTNAFAATFSVMVKLSYKFASTLYYRLNDRNISELIKLRI